MNLFACGKCKEKTTFYSSETRKGAASLITFYCKGKNCYWYKTLKTSKVVFTPLPNNRKQSFHEVNSRLVLATTNIGKGLPQLRRFMATMNIPPVSKRT